MKADLPHTAHAAAEFNIEAAITKEKQKLSPLRLVYVSSLENDISRGDVKMQAEKQMTQLADFWKDSVGIFVPYAYYFSEAAKWDNSAKKLTFATLLIYGDIGK